MLTFLIHIFLTDGLSLDFIFSNNYLANCLYGEIKHFYFKVKLFSRPAEIFLFFNQIHLSISLGNIRKPGVLIMFLRDIEREHLPEMDYKKYLKREKVLWNVAVWKNFANTAQNMKFSINNFFSKYDQILTGKFHFLCSESS